MTFTNHIFYRLVSSVNNNIFENYHASYASSVVLIGFAPISFLFIMRMCCSLHHRTEIPLCLLRVALVGFESTTMSAYRADTLTTASQN